MFLLLAPAITSSYQYDVVVASRPEFHSGPMVPFGTFAHRSALLVFSFQSWRFCKCKKKRRVDCSRSNDHRNRDSHAGRLAPTGASSRRAIANQDRCFADFILTTADIPGLRGHVSYRT